jgi:hypothetical protein
VDRREINSDFARSAIHASFWDMRFPIFLSGSLILALGGAAMLWLSKSDALGFLVGTAQLGGGLIICGLFSIRMPWHGIIGAGVLALLGAARGLGNIPGWFKFLIGDRSHGIEPILEIAVTLIALALLLRVIQQLFRERTRRLLESED